MADTAAALVIQLSADFKSFQREMRSATGVFDAEARKIAKRQADLKKKLSNWSMDFTGLSGMSKALVGLSAVGVVGGLTALVNKSLEAAGAVGDIANRAGVTTDKLQELRFGLSQAGASAEDADAALIKLNGSFGQFVNNGTGKAAAAFKSLGIDKMIDSGQVRNTAQAFDAIVTKVQGLGSATEKAGYLAQIFGKELGPKMVEYVSQGADGIAQVTKQAHDLGLVLDAETVRGAKEAKDKLDALFSTIKMQGIAAFARLAPEIGNVTQQIIDGLPHLVDWVQHWADFFGLVKQSPLSRLRYDLSAAMDEVTALQSQKAGNSGFYKNLFGLSDAEFETLIAAAKAKAAKARKELNKEELGAITAPVSVTPAVSGTEDNRVTRYINDHPPALHRTDDAADKEAAAAAQKLQALNQRRGEELAKTKLDATTAAAVLLAAQDQLSVDLLRGTAGYYDAVKKQIDDQYNSRIEVIDAEKDKQLATLDKMGKDWAGYEQAKTNITEAAAAKRAEADVDRKGKIHETGASGLVQQAIDDGAQQVRQYELEAGAIDLTSGALERYVFIQNQKNEAKSRGIELSAEDIAAIEAEADKIGKAADALDALQEKHRDAVALSDEIRNGLSDIGVAALDGFGSAKQAAGQFLKQLAQMILQLYVMKPLMEGLLGKSGTQIGGGGGFNFGSIISGIGGMFSGPDLSPISVTPNVFGGYAAGTNSATPGLHWVGEKGPELLNIPGGSQVIPNSALRMPSVPKAVSANHTSSITFAPVIDARGATEGTDVLIEKKLRAAMGPFLAAANEQTKRSFPGLMDRDLQRRR